MGALKPGHKCAGCGTPVDSDGLSADNHYHFGPNGCSETKEFVSNLAKLKHKKAAELKAHLGKECFVRRKGSKTEYDRCILAELYRPGSGGMSVVVPWDRPAEKYETGSNRIFWSVSF